MKGLLAFDIDGTLTHRLDWIDPKVVQFLKTLTEDKWQIAFLTGRTYAFAQRITRSFDFPYTIAYQNGADIFEMPSKKNLQRNFLSADFVPQIDEIYQGQHEDFIIYAGTDKGDFCYYRPERFSKKMLEYLKVLESLSDAWQPSDFIFEKGTSFPLIKTFGEKKVVKELYDRLSAHRALEVSMIRDPIDPTLYLNLITDRQASKGHCVQFLREHFKPPKIIAAGDDHNDLKMLKAADIAIAIQTAPPEVLAVADVLAKPAQNLGIIQAVEVAIGRN